MALGLPLHGGDLTAAAARWGQPDLGWLDLSTGINPWPYPLPDFAPEDWNRLPGAEAEHSLRRAAARRFGAASPECVLAAPGTSALIRALPRCHPTAEVAILGPTYGEHEAAWRAAGHNVRMAADLEQAKGAQAVVVVNPNNPDGRVHAAAQLLPLADELAARGGLLVVDEAFADADPALSVAPQSRPGLVVLRSFGKFYGLAGLRLGFAVAQPALRAALAAQLGPWPVAGAALTVGAAALADEEWGQATMARLARAAADLDEVLLAAGLNVVGGTCLFRLASSPHAPELYERLGRAGILVRAFAERPQFLRFGLPPDLGGLERLRCSL